MKNFATFLAGLTLLFFIAVVTLANDPPHNDASGVSCSDCHGQTLLENQSPFYTDNTSDSAYNRICMDRCHTVGGVSPYDNINAPPAVSHTPGGTVIKCTTCHHNHDQDQIYSGKNNKNAFFLATGTLDTGAPTPLDYDSGTDTTIITYATMAPTDPGSKWSDLSLLAAKTDTGRGAMLVANHTSRKRWPVYIITSIDTGARTITVKGNVTAASKLGVFFGQVVRRQINYAPVAGMPKSVTFYTPEDTNSLGYDESGTGIDSNVNGLCQVCHTATNHFQNDGTVTTTGTHDTNNSYSGNNCSRCHPHTYGFTHFGGNPDCTVCHGHDDGFGGDVYSGSTDSHSRHTDDPSFPDLACDTCHDTSLFPLLKPGAGAVDTNGDGLYDLTETNICNPCHVVRPTSWKGSVCTSCHSGVQSGRAPAAGQFTSNSHHVQGPEVDGEHCYQCHWEADANGRITSYHGGENNPGASVDLVVQQDEDITPRTSLDPDNVAHRVQYIAGGDDGSGNPDATDWRDVQIPKINTHCLGCHDDDSSDDKPFGDDKTPKEYAWDGNSIDARYSQTDTTDWGKYSGVGVSPKNLRTKAYSAHGNAVANEGGWDLSESWPDKRNGSVNVACYDCHNSHGSSVSGPTASYTSATTSGGILKDTSTGAGGYSVTYQPTAGGTAGNKNEHNAGAALCFDCHLTADAADNPDTKPWSYDTTFGASQAIIGYFDSEFLAPGVAGPQQRYAYKGLSVNAGGHFDASSPLNSTPMHNINGLCTPCHDPHGISPTSLGTCSKPAYTDKISCVADGGHWGQDYGIPLLKGTWLTSPYKEDVAPKNNVAGTARNEKVQYHLDQGTIPGNVIAESDSQFAGLCLNCHQKDDLTDGTDGSTWKSVDRIHESVKGWGANTQHNYSCSKCHSPHIGSILPRLMVTNCLDPKHKGWLGDNPSPKKKGYGYGGYFEGCQGDSISAGDCGSGWGDPAYGYGNFPGFWTRFRGLPANPATYIPPTLTGCHSGEAADHSWNNITQWADSSPTPPQFPTLFNEPDANCSSSNCGTTVSWQASSAPDGDGVQYMVEVDDDADFSSVDRTSAWQSSTSYYFTMPNDINGITLYWRVKARDAVHTAQVSIWSPVDEFTINYQPSRPSRIAEPDLECGSSCLVTLQWLAVTIIDADPTEYYVEVDNNIDFSSPEYDSGGWISGLSFDVTLPTETSWWWRVRARDSVHTSIISQWSTTDGFILTARPARPTLIYEPDNRCAPDCSVTLEWNPVTAPDGDPVEYRVQIDTSGHTSNVDWNIYSPPDLQESAWISGTSWTVTIATDDTFWWHVEVRDSVHTTLSNWSSNDLFNTTGNPEAPVLIDEADFVCASGACLDITLDWSAVTSLDGDTIEYYVEIDNNSDFSSPEYETVSWVTDIFWDVTVATASHYYWRVQARDSVHPTWISSWSTVDGFTVARSNPPPTPVLIAEPDYNSTTSVDINLQWNSVIDPDGDPVEYQVQIDVNTNFNTGYLQDSGWISATNWDVTVLACWTWRWRVRARDATHPEAVSAWTTADSFLDLSINCGGSCPFLYVWDGDSFEFEADLYGAGKLAAKSSSGYFNANPHDNYIIEAEPVIKDGFYEMRLVEERYEVNYLDQLKLYAIDIPVDRDLFATKQSFTTTFNGIAEELYTVDRNLQNPISITHVITGEDVAAELASSDENIVTLSNDRNLDFEYHTLELDLGDLTGAQHIKLIIDGVTAFPNSAAGAARSRLFGPRTKLQVLDANGSWVSVSKSIAVLPKPPEFRRPFVFDISNIFQTDDHRVRLTFLFKTYLDSIFIDTTPNDSISLEEVQLVFAELRSYGHSDQQTLWDDYYEYVYNEESPNHEHDYFPGSYTKFGEVSSLLTDIDDKFAIYGSGDEIALRFMPISPPADGYTRKYLMYTNGYYKDAKIDVDHTVEPMPFSGMSNFPYDPAVEHYPDDADHLDYLETYNTREYIEGP